MPVIRPYREEDLDAVTFRPEEEIECVLAGHGDGKGFIRYCAEREVVYVALDPQGLPFLFFGRLKDEDGVGAFVWMQGDNERMFRNRVALIRGLGTVLDKWHETTPLLYTYMNPESRAHLRLLLRFGFTAVGAVEYSPGRPYYELVRTPQCPQQ